jgi:hypothetical protein
MKIPQSTKLNPTKSSLPILLWKRAVSSSQGDQVQSERQEAYKIDTMKPQGGNGNGSKSGASSSNAVHTQVFHSSSQPDCTTNAMTSPKSSQKKISLNSVVAQFHRITSKALR